MILEDPIKVIQSLIVVVGLDISSKLVAEERVVMVRKRNKVVVDFDLLSNKRG